MNNSVWYEQIDKALISFITNKVKLSGVPAHVFVRKPEEEFKETTFPCITIYNLSTKPHQSQEDFPREAILPYNSAEGVLYIERKPSLFEHLYQIDFWARYQSQMNEMLYIWCSEVEKDFNLTVKTISGSPSSIYLVEDRNIRKSDLLSGKERLFHSFMSYRVYSDIDTGKKETVPMITDVEVINEEYS